MYTDLWRPLEDGSNTQMRLSMIESLVPPKSDGPVFHFHEMHDEGFYVTVSDQIGASFSVLWFAMFLEIC